MWRPGQRLVPPDPAVGVAPTSDGILVAPCGSGPLAVLATDLGAFVLAHPHLRWVAFDAAAVFWQVLEGVAEDRRAADAWWRAADENRLHDPILLDALVRLATSGDPSPRRPAAVAAGAGLEPAGTAGTNAAAAAATYRAIRRTAVQLPASPDAAPDARPRFGLLTEAVQVRTMIALAAVTRAGVRLDRAVLAAAGRAGEQLLRALDRSGGAVVHPAYRVLTATGRTACASPNLQGVPRAGTVRRAVVPRPGRLLLTIDHTLAELRALAAVCLRRYGRSRLADVLRAGGDPHAHTAAALLGVAPEAFATRLAGADATADAYREYRRAAKAVNFGVPGGLGDSALVGLARDRFGVALSAADAAHWRATLVRDVYPELAAYLSDARAGSVSTLTGRVRGRLTPTQSLNSPFQGLAADGAGFGLFGLVRAGHRVIGFVHDEYLLEIPDRGGYADRAEVEAAVEIVRRGMQEVLGDVPAGCRWAVSRRWGDAAPHATVGERVYPSP